MSHTPGPWIITHGDDLEFVVSPQNKHQDDAICTIYQPDAEANAHLIAAAPEMLEALENLLTIINEPDKVKLEDGKTGLLYWFESTDVEEARKVILKAKGIS